MNEPQDDNGKRRRRKELKARSVIRIRRSNIKEPEAETEVETPIERRCRNCNQPVWLSVSQATNIPPELTDCIDCFKLILQRGEEALRRYGIILSVIPDEDEG